MIALTTSLSLDLRALMALERETPACFTTSSMSFSSRSPASSSPSSSPSTSSTASGALASPPADGLNCSTAALVACWERSSISALPKTMKVCGPLGLLSLVLNTSGSLITKRMFLLFFTVTRTMPGLASCRAFAWPCVTSSRCGSAWHPCRRRHPLRLPFLACHHRCRQTRPRLLVHRSSTCCLFYPHVLCVDTPCTLR